MQDYLNGTGVTTVRGKATGLNSVAAILHNRKFLGEYKLLSMLQPSGGWKAPNRPVEPEVLFSLRRPTEKASRFYQDAFLFRIQLIGIVRRNLLE